MFKQLHRTLLDKGKEKLHSPEMNIFRNIFRYSHSPFFLPRQCASTVSLNQHTFQLKKRKMGNGINSAGNYFYTVKWSNR